MPPNFLDNATLAVLYGATEVNLRAEVSGLTVELPIPVLAGRQTEHWPLPPVVSVENSPGLALCHCQGGIVIGVVVEKLVTEHIEDQTYAAFRRFLTAAGPVALYRVWNYVPNINFWQDGLENYHRFNRGRWRAYTGGISPDMTGLIPAASAVGYVGDSLVSIFIAGQEKPTHVENPLQMPAWQYPTEYGPQSPSFSRGTTVPWPPAAGAAANFISGTASIRGHQTLGLGSLAQQCTITLENLQQVATEMGSASLEQLVQSSTTWSAKIYLRHATDLPELTASLTASGHAWLLENATILHSDICRASLAVEIEVTCI